MDAVTGFVAIVSLLLALAGGESTAQRKAGNGQKELAAASTQPATQTTSSKLATNHNETLVRDAAPTE